MWNDDFHHTAKVALTGSRDGYFRDYTGRAQEFVSCVRRGFLYQGQWYAWQKQTRGRRAAGCRRVVIVFLQNHDQVGNTFLGDRAHAKRARPLSRTDGADVARPADADAVHGPGVRRVDALHVLRRSHGSSPRRCTRAGASSSDSSTRTRTKRRSSWCRRRTTKQLSSTPSSTGRSGAQHAKRSHFHRDLLRMRACDPVISHQDLARSTARRCRSTLRAALVRCRAWRSSVGGQSRSESCRSRRPPSRCWRRRVAAAGNSCGPASARATAARREPVADDGHGAWRIQAQSAVLLVRANVTVEPPDARLPRRFKIGRSS